VSRPVILLNRRHLRRILISYSAYYHGASRIWDWARMRRSCARCKVLNAARWWPFPRSADCIIATNAAPPKRRHQVQEPQKPRPPQLTLIGTDTTRPDCQCGPPTCSGTRSKDTCLPVHFANAATRSERFDLSHVLRHWLRGFGERHRTAGHFSFARERASIGFRSELCSTEAVSGDQS
jgi:hypothetical protein